MNCFLGGISFIVCVNMCVLVGVRACVCTKCCLINHKSRYQCVTPSNRRKQIHHTSTYINILFSSVSCNTYFVCYRVIKQYNLVFIVNLPRALIDKISVFKRTGTFHYDVCVCECVSCVNVFHMTREESAPSHYRLDRALLWFQVQAKPLANRPAQVFSAVYLYIDYMFTH